MVQVNWQAQAAHQIEVAKTLLALCSMVGGEDRQGHDQADVGFFAILIHVAFSLVCEEVSEIDVADVGVV